MAYDLLRALPGVHDLVSHRHAQIIIRVLGTSPGAPGPHAFAVRKITFVGATSALR
jgi:hypothetical protein